MEGKSADLTCNRLWEPLQDKRLNTDNNPGVSYENEYIYPAIVVILSTNKWVQIYFSVIYSWTNKDVLVLGSCRTTERNSSSISVNFTEDTIANH